MRKFSLAMISLISLSAFSFECPQYEAQVFATVLESSSTTGNREFNCQYKIEINRHDAHFICPLGTNEIEKNLVFDSRSNGECLSDGESFSGYLVKDGLGIIFID